MDTIKQNSKDQARAHAGQGVQRGMESLSSIRSINVGSICEEDDDLSMDMCDSSTLSGHTEGTTKGEKRRKKMVKALSKFKRNNQSTSSSKSLGLGSGRLRNFHRRKSDESEQQRPSSQNDLINDETSQTESEADLPSRREDWSRESSMKRSFAVRHLSVSKEEDIQMEDDTDPNDKDLQQAVKRGSENASSTSITDLPDDRDTASE